MEELIVKITAELAEWRGLAIVWGELVEALLTAGTFTIASVAMMVLYQCPKCGREAEIAGFINKVTVICRCGYKMEKVMTTNRKMGRKRYIQLKLFG
ncbi:hypothetical protein [Planifilum fimeticola]